MRESSAFKRALHTLPLGALLKLKGPQGVMTLHEDRSRAAGFIAGGADWKRSASPGALRPHED